MHVLAGGVMGPEDRLRDSRGTGGMAIGSVFHIFGQISRGVWHRAYITARVSLAASG